MTYVHMYECPHCNNRIKRRRNTARLRYACKPCGEVRSFERQRRITTAEQHQ